MRRPDCTRLLNSAAALVLRTQQTRPAVLWNLLAQVANFRTSKSIVCCWRTMVAIELVQGIFLEAELDFQVGQTLVDGIGLGKA